MNRSESEIRTGFKEDRVRRMKTLQAKAKPIVRRIKYLFDHGDEKDLPEYERKSRELKKLTSELACSRGAERDTVRISGIRGPLYETRTERKTR